MLLPNGRLRAAVCVMGIGIRELALGDPTTFAKRARERLLFAMRHLDAAALQAGEPA